MTPIHFENFASPNEPKIMSQLCGELYRVSCVGLVSGGVVQLCDLVGLY